ncbi:MAG: hypothetical protein WC635_00940 [Bacteriovorax sp.]|jgi:hypothetical protein
MKTYVILLLSFFISSLALAHDGPAYPILVDKTFGTNKLSVWADPDVGLGSFWLYLEGENGQDFTLLIKASPVDQPAHLLTSFAKISKNEPGKSVFIATLPFDREIMWNVEISLKQNNLEVASFKLPLEVTPPGPNKLEVAVYFIPFLLLGFLWIKVVVAKRKKSV